MLKENDFVEIDYVAKIKDNGIFDLTMEDIAKENKVYDSKNKYKPVIVCIGKGDVIKGLDRQLVGKDIGKYTIEVSAEEGFGKKNNKLIKLVPTKEFTKQNVKPMPGMQLNISGFVGKIISVTGGRTLVDFNNPLSGRDLIYELEIKRKITDKKEQLEGFLDNVLKEYELELKDNEAVIKCKVEERLKEKLEEEIKNRVKIDKITFKE